MNVWLKLTMDDFVYVFDAWRKWSCGVVCVWPRTNSDTIVSMFIWFCYLEWMIYGGKLIWCDLLTSKICLVERTVLVSVRIFINKINTYRLKRWQYGPRTKLSIVSRMLRVLNIQKWHFVYIYFYFYYVGKICTDYMKAWNYITIDFHQESRRSDCVMLGKL